MGIDPQDLDRMAELPAEKLHEWIVGQVPQSRFYQAAKNELERRKEEKQQERDEAVSYRQWISIFIALAVLLLSIASALGIFRR